MDNGQDIPRSPEPGEAALPRRDRVLADAMDAAWSITDERQKVLTLAGIAGSVAVFDLDRAVLLIADAERIARSITSEDAKAYILARVVGAVADADPDRVERIARSITIEYYRAGALARIVQAAAAADHKVYSDSEDFT